MIYRKTKFCFQYATFLVLMGQYESLNKNILKGVI
jgi:hypothetical protein